MEFPKWIQRYMKIFNILGQTSFVCHKSNQKHQSNYIPIMILLIFTLYTSISSFTYQYKYMRVFGLANSFVANCLILTQMTLNLTVIIQTIIYRRNLKLIIKHFARIHGILKVQLGHDLSLSEMNRSYLSKVGITFTFFGVSTVALVSLPLSIGDLLASGHFYLLLFFTHVSNMHILLYLDMFRFLLQNLIQNITDIADTMQSRNTHKFCVKNTLRYCQSVHFRLSNISQEIGRHFGWSMVLSHLQSFFLAAYSVYWLFIFNYTYSSIVSIRKYFNFNYYFLLLVFLLPFYFLF